VRGILYLTAILSLLPHSAFGQAAVGDLPAAPDAAQQQAPTPQTTPPAASSSSTQASPTKTSETTQEEQQRAEQELKKEERQRILGVMPAFNTTHDRNAAPLSTRQKFQLDMHSSLDPFVFALAALDAGGEQAEDTYPEYGQGTEGYAKRFGAAYADTFDGYLWGNAILPSMLHEDPRYYSRGSGSIPRRALWAAWSTLWWRRDNGTWGPAYANVAGNFVAGGISNLYYPASDRGFSLTVTRALTVMAEGAIGSELVEFWPDVSRRFVGRKKHPVTP
jgi:hypothetical protein